MEPKRRLPLLPSGSPTSPRSGDLSGGDADEDRPPWHWIGFGTAAIFGAWLPLAYLAEGLKGRAFRSYVGSSQSAEEAQAAVRALSDSDRARLTALTLVLYVVPLIVGAYAGGLLVGKWGGKAGIREAALSGVATAVIVSALSFASAGLSWAPLVALALATSAAALGGFAGKRASAKRKGENHA